MSGVVRLSCAALAVSAFALLANKADSSRAGDQLVWALAYQHVDPTIDDVIGLDLLRVGQGLPRALTRRPKRTRDFDKQPRWSPDGKTVAFVRSSEHQGLYVVAATGGQPRRLVNFTVDGFAFSPDGGTISFSRTCSGPARTCRTGTYVVRVDGSGLRRLTPLVGALSWAPHGVHLACRCGEAIRILDLGSALPRTLTATRDGLLGDPAWSPDGRWIAFGRNCEDIRVGGHLERYCDVALMDPEGRLKRTLRAGRRTGELAVQWRDSQTVIVRQWLNDGGKSFAVDIADPNSARLLWPRFATDVTVGERGTVAFITYPYDKPRLIVVEPTGHVLVRKPLPGQPSEIGIWVGWSAEKGGPRPAVR